ncbi:hypothetical protein NDU88_005605 [Pleurodeles waltl]|uniref:Uncharacterized protein n=1 Tax=Pleurodeles waltl TaxID=8319 RepID=A0AAV7PJ17_PLEWA|nr:hypothetical protein NDU88_005605 [Pleurodeles waltl]
MRSGGLMADDKVQEAFWLLSEAGRLDLVRDGALGPPLQARRAASRVAVAILACSPPHSVSATKTAVSVRGRGRARGSRRKEVGTGQGGLLPTRPSGMSQSTRRAGIPEIEKGGVGRQDGAGLVKHAECYKRDYRSARQGGGRAGTQDGQQAAGMREPLSAIMGHKQFRVKGHREGEVGSVGDPNEGETWEGTDSLSPE